MAERARRDPLTGAVTLHVPERARRPSNRGPHQGACPFCPGNETLLPEVLFEKPATDARPWATRTVPNKFPLVRPAEAGEARSLATGRHEVIIESPIHDRDVAAMTPSETADVVATYRERAAVHWGQHRTLVLFRNRGPRGGASQNHPHAQIVAMDAVPPAVAQRVERQRRHFEDTGRCLVCDLAAAEIAFGRRIVARRGGVMAFVPETAAGPFEVLVTPEAHRPAFAATTDDDLAGFAAVLHIVLANLARYAGDPDYSFAVADIRHNSDQSAWHHWHLRLRPVMTTPAGFELGTGLAVNGSDAEEDAALLRGENFDR